MNLHAVADAKGSAETAEEVDLVALDFALDVGRFAQHESLAREDAATEGSVEAERSRRLERALDAGLAVEEAGPVGTVSWGEKSDR